ncbi:hypothetical protein CR513_39562, partial [Mucuna pruriens]
MILQLNLNPREHKGMNNYQQDLSNLVHFTLSLDVGSNAPLLPYLDLCNLKEITMMNGQRQ